MSRVFDDVPTLRGSPNASPSARIRRRSLARRLERCCCQTLSYFPLLFVHGLTGWAVWVAISVSLMKSNSLSAYAKATLVFVLYALANLSYSVAVFTSPGSPLDERQDWGSKWGSETRGSYQGLPTYERDERGADFDSAQFGPMTTVTAKSSGQPRYCKKCRCVKPDRAHHCSTCGRCVLKMDHHCPWLATCVGLRNYKAFLLFLIYTSTFCWICFTYSASWVWAEIINDVQMDEGMLVINIVLLAVLAGIIGLVLSAFTGWHIYLTLTGQTTIESLEKTRYLAPIQKTLQPQTIQGRNHLADDSDLPLDRHSLGDQLKTIHANAIPGVLRPEEGEGALDEYAPSQRSSPTPAQDHLRRSYASLEAQRERERYHAYLDEKDSERLPNAFNLGRKHNFLQVFGYSPPLWFVPVINSCGDGWQWEISQEWRDARDKLARDRAAYADNGSFQGPTGRANGSAPWTAHATPSLLPPPRIGDHADGHSVQMHPIDRRKQHGEHQSYDNDVSTTSTSSSSSSDVPGDPIRSTSNWNDVPDEYLRSTKQGSPLNRGRSNAQPGKGKGD